MSMAKYTIEQYESAGRALVREFGGLKGLAEQAVGQLERNMTLAKAIGDNLSYSVLVYTYDREVWLKRHKVPFKDADKTFNELFGQAGAYLVNKYMMKHGYSIKNKWGNVIAPYGLVKTSPMKRKKR